MRIEQAIQIFVEGFAMSRCRTHPYLVVPTAPGLIVLRDAPRRSDQLRRSEAVIWGLSPRKADDLVRELPDPKLCVCAVTTATERPADWEREFKALGYRLQGNQPFFVASVKQSEVAVSTNVRRVLARSEFEAMRLADDGRPPLPLEKLEDESANWRTYAAWCGSVPVGHVSSIQTDARSSWVSNLFVHPDHRRKGLATALMQTMLADDYRFGVRESVLLATTAGARLYPHLGYEQIGLLQVFNPIDWASRA